MIVTLAGSLGIMASQAFCLFIGYQIGKPKKNLANQKNYTELLIMLNHMINNAEGQAKDDLTNIRTALMYNKSILELRND